MRRLRPFALALCVARLVACGGRGDDLGRQQTQPTIGASADDADAASGLGFPAFATKNTTRVGGADPVADAAAVARAVYPATSRSNRPPAVALVDARDWRIGVAAAVLASEPFRAPILLSNGQDLPVASRDAL